MVSKRVMIVDDAIFMRKVLREILTENGYDVVGEVNRGTDVLDKFKEWKPDLVTMDIMLPFVHQVLCHKALERRKESHDVRPEYSVVFSFCTGQSGCSKRSF